MINADEHKKFLEQVAELEKDSVNYFDVEKEFFLIDSDNLSQVRPKLYGHSIQRTGIYEDEDLTAEAIAGLDGRGCYVYVEVKDGEITIKQDINGCWGIYLFRHGDYFALSNSFFRLLDHVKFKYPLTINHDYCHYLMLDECACQAYQETAVNEIRILDRNAIVHVDIKRKALELEFIDYKPHSIAPDSEEGITILDRWMEFWSGVLRGIAQRTNFIRADLSGGFDTRMSFVILLHSGLDLNKMTITSYKSSFPIILDDYEVASQIAKRYDFELNRPLPPQQFLNYSLTDLWNIDLYYQQAIRNLPTVSFKQKAMEKCYYLTGFSGEYLRNTWHMPPQEFMDSHCSKARVYSFTLAPKLKRSIQNILENAYRGVCDKYHIEDAQSLEIPQYVYHETRSRNHCGKDMVGRHLKNIINLAPAQDPEIQKLRLKADQCPDYNFFMGLLYTRYAPDLLEIRFDKYHKPIDLENILPYAKEINKRFPRKDVAKATGGGQFHLQPRDKKVEQIISQGRNNPNLPWSLPSECLKAAFESSKTYGLFTSHFDSELYNYAASYYGEKDGFIRERPMYAILGVTKVIEDVEISQRNHPPYHYIQRFLEQDFASIHKNLVDIPNKFKSYLTARIDIRLPMAGDFQIQSISDEKATVWKPKWFQNGGVGYQIQSYAGNLEIVTKTSVDGKINLSLKGLDVRAPEDKSKRIPYWIDYTKLAINGETIFDTLTPAWHDKTYSYTVNAKAGEELKIQVEWLPHRSDT